MVELVDWLRAQLDEDERIARAATPGPWSVNDESYAEWVIAANGTEVVAGGRWGGEASVFESTEDALHIAAHDPARVLRETDAKRLLMKQIFMYEAKIDGEWGCCHDADAIEAGMCDETSPNGIEALRLLALPYKDRPGYREEW